MKKSRLLEIIREEISEALNVLVTNKKGETTTMPFNTPDEKKAVTNLKADSNITNIETTAGQNIKEGEKRKKLAEKYQLDEETINEMASVIQTKKVLTKLGDENRLELVQAVEKETLDQFKKNPIVSPDGRLARKLDPEEVTGKRDTRGYGADFERNFKKKAGMDFLDFTTQIDIELKKKFPEEKFTPGLATNTTEKDAANQITGKTPDKKGPKADPNKPKAEKPASTGKKGRPAGEPKAKVATRTAGDDGFDKVSYSDEDDEVAAATKAISGDETAKDLGKIAYSKKLTPEEETQYETALKGIKAKIKRIEDGEEKPDDRTLLKKAYQNSEIQRLFKAKGSSLNDILKGIIG